MKKLTKEQLERIANAIGFTVDREIAPIKMRLSTQVLDDNSVEILDESQDGKVIARWRFEQS